MNGAILRALIPLLYQSTFSFNSPFIENGDLSSVIDPAGPFKYTAKVTLPESIESRADNYRKTKGGCHRSCAAW